MLMKKNVNNDVSKDSPIHGYTWVYRVYRGVQGINGDKQSITIT